jgi:hypothetical protein
MRRSFKQRNRILIFAHTLPDPGVAGCAKKDRVKPGLDAI